MATVSTQSIALIIGFVILFKGKHDIHLKLIDFKPDFVHIKRAFKIGLPSSVELSMRAVGMMAITFLVVRFGTNTLAGYGAGSNLVQLIMILALGLSMSISTLVGQNIGAGNIPRAARIAKFGASLGFTIFSIFGIIAYVFANQIIFFFVPKAPEVIQEGAHFLRIVCLSWGFLGLQLCLIGVLRASGNTILPMFIVLISQLVLQFPIAYFLSHYTVWAQTGIWLAFPISTLVTAITTLIIFSTGNWKKKEIISNTKEFQLQVIDAI